jgi:hypothetical protein
MVVPFDLAALRARGLSLILVNLASGTLELRFTDHVEVWQKAAADAKGPLRSFNGEAYVGPREREPA